MVLRGTGQLFVTTIIMIKVELKGAKEFSAAMQKAALLTKKTFPEFIHDQGMRFMFSMYKTFHTERPKLGKIDSDVFNSLESGGGLRVNKRNRKKAESLMGKYQKDIDSRIEIENAKRETKKRREKINALKAERNKLRVQKRRGGTISYYSPTSKYGGNKYGRDFLKLKGLNDFYYANEIAHLEKQSQRFQDIARKRRYKTYGRYNKMNLPALAARIEINRRHSGSGSMGNAFLEGYRKLKALPLGSQFSFEQNCKDRHTWSNHGSLSREKYLLNLVLDNKGFRTEREENLRRIERVFKERSDDMISHANKKVEGLFR
jgi:hypothetical protein